ncbi:MAG: ribonuclease HI [Gemmobacter sp.]
MAEPAPPAKAIWAFTDGACSGNPGPGGWGVLLQAREDGAVAKEKELCGGEAMTTNNRMELLAAISALETLKRASRLILVTDSAYVKDGITTWMPNWKRKNWRTAGGSPVKNLDLWQRLDVAQSRHAVDWRWIKGHAGHAENERADALARKGMAPFKPAATTGLVE